jgi:hypothetical protein
MLHSFDKDAAGRRLAGWGDCISFTPEKQPAFPDFHERRPTDATPWYYFQVAGFFIQFFIPEEITKLGRAKSPLVPLFQRGISPISGSSDRV